MNDIQKERSLSLFADELVYLNSCLTADAGTRHLADDVSDELETLDEMLQAERDIHRKVVLNRAQVKIRIRLAESYIRDVYAAGLFEVRQDRKNPLYQKLFKYDQVSVLRLNAKAQMEEMLRMKSVLKLTIYEDDFRDTLHETLDKALVEINGAIDSRAELEEEQMHHRLDVEQCKDRVNNVRGSVYGELLKMSRSHGQEKSWARSFFPETKATKKLSPEEIAKKNAEKAKRASDKAALAADVAADKSRKAAARSKLEADKVELETKSKTEAENEAKVRARVRAQLEEDLRARIEEEERAKLKNEELEREIRARLALELNGEGDAAQV